MASSGDDDELLVDFTADNDAIIDLELGIPIVYKTEVKQLSASDFSFSRRIPIPPQIDPDSSAQKGIEGTAQGA